MKKRFLMLLLVLGLCLSFASGICEETEPVIFDWGEMNATLIGLSENPELSQSMEPTEGKWITLVLVVAGSEKDLNEVDQIIHDKIQLEGLEIRQKMYSQVGGTIRYTSEGIEQELTLRPGYVRIFFEAPADYDLQNAQLFYDGEPVPVAIEPEGILTAGE